MLLVSITRPFEGPLLSGLVLLTLLLWVSGGWISTRQGLAGKVKAALLLLVAVGVSTLLLGLLLMRLATIED
jgi:hypothetical protein